MAARSLTPMVVHAADDVWELTWATDGRATFRYGAQVVAGEAHIVWPRIGSHSILDDPGA